MKVYTPEEIKATLAKHVLWLKNDPQGIRANLYGAYLYGADLSGADLSRADLSRADLYGANLSGAYLYGAYLSGANLSGADLSGADLSRADLSRADLSGANLSGANLSEANLSRADLSGADLPNFQIVPEIGFFYGYKKIVLPDNSKGILMLIIGRMSQRTSSLIGRKCRCEYAKVKSITNLDGTKSYQEAVSTHDSKFTYKVGEIVRPDKYDGDIRVECTSGIHFFITRKEAVEY